MAKRNFRSVEMDHIALCGKLIAQKVSHVEISAWSNAYYHNLGLEIWKESRIRLSVNTLKRVFGKIRTDDHYLPHTATLDALAIFLGYENWEVFKKTNQLPVIAASEKPESELAVSNTKPVAGAKGKVIRYAAYILVMAIAFWAFFNWSSGSSYKEVRMSCANPRANNLHAVAFKLICPTGFKDTSSFMLDFNDREQEKMNCQQKEVRHYYHTPGWYRVRLKHREEFVDSTIVVVQSKGWVAYGSKSAPSPKRYCIANFDGRIASMSKLRSKDLANVGLDTAEQFFLNFANIKDSRVNGDNFELIASVKSSDYLKRGECASVNFSLFGEFGQHYTGIVNPECITWADANFSEQLKTGIRHDLSQLGHNLVNGGYSGGTHEISIGYFFTRRNIRMLSPRYF